MCGRWIVPPGTVSNNIMQFFSKPKIHAPLFVIASLIALFSFFLIIFLMDINRSNSVTNNQGPVNIEVNSDLLLQQYDMSDPYITKKINGEKGITRPVITENDPSLGSGHPDVTIVIYSDFTCQYCREQENNLKKAIINDLDRIKLIWKDYPDLNRGSISWLAAASARCAQNQGKFWEYHDILFEDDGILSEDSLYDIASNLNLDLDVFENCLDDQGVFIKLRNNILEADALNIYGVPFIFINDVEIFGMVSEKELSTIINKELGK